MNHLVHGDGFAGRIHLQWRLCLKQWASEAIYKWDQSTLFSYVSCVAVFDGLGLQPDLCFPTVQLRVSERQAAPPVFFNRQGVLIAVHKTLANAFD